MCKTRQNRESQTECFILIKICFVFAYLFSNGTHFLMCINNERLRAT